MNQLLLIIGLTILYYVVLFWFDQRGRKAFKVKQQALMAQTAELPTIKTTVESTADLLGATTNLANTDLATVNILAERKEQITPSAGLSTELKGDMKKLAGELDIETTPTTNKNDLMATLKSTTDITNMSKRSL